MLVLSRYLTESLVVGDSVVITASRFDRERAVLELTISAGDTVQKVKLQPDGRCDITPVIAVVFVGVDWERSQFKLGVMATLRLTVLRAELLRRGRRTAGAA